jgi:hypothetical protein
MQQLRQFIFMLASFAHIFFLGTLAITVFGLGPIGRAIASRIRSGPAPAPPARDPSLADLTTTIGEVLERLDFSERLLTELNHKALGTGSRPRQAQSEAMREITPT